MEISEIVIFAISSVFECNFVLLKKCMHWLGQGSKFGLNENEVINRPGVAGAVLQTPS